MGITDYAQKQLGDVVYVELPDVGRTVTQGEAIGTIESVKAVSEIFAPVSGEIVGVNATLKDSPETINSDPHGTWMMTIRLANPSRTHSSARQHAIRRRGEVAVVQARHMGLHTSDTFQARHIGPRERDLPAMLETIGVSSLDQLVGRNSARRRFGSSGRSISRRERANIST